MISRIITICILIYFCIIQNVHGQLDEKRKFTLDSLVSFIPKDKLFNLDSVHAFLHRYGQSDEERVWMYYGYLGIYYTYDYKRYGDRKAPDFSPQYTAQRRKGVCRDYARVFEYLCLKSNIPCLISVGKSPERFFKKFKRYKFQFRSYSNHEWNLVKFNHTWHIIDATWSGIEKKEKISVWNSKFKKYEQKTIKISSRKYYDGDPMEMSKNHVPIHPAFYLLTEIPTYKMSLKKRKKQKRLDYYASNYDYQTVLDSIDNYEYKYFNTYFNHAVLAYSEHDYIAFEYDYLASDTTWKTARYFQPSLNFYDERIANLKKITDHLTQNCGYDYSYKFEIYKQSMLRKKRKLQKKLDATKKKK